MRQTITYEAGPDQLATPENVEVGVRWVKERARPFVKKGWKIARDTTATLPNDGPFIVDLVLDSEAGLKPTADW